MLYDTLRLAVSHQAVFLLERLHCGRLMKPSPERWWFECQPDFESWVHDAAVKTNNFQASNGKILALLSLSKPEDKQSGNLRPGVIDEWEDEGRVKKDNMNLTVSG